ncbi:FkbM family methyltransferase [Ancylobacter sp. IITR112]|uniref:FkbM family methyltransferase n=1 Tax=Ancylobacter sp. IITR112 TaxID=3138073 RepID=UPI00352A96BF
MISRTVELIYLRDLIFDLKINCVLDVGANQGQYAKELRAIGYKGLIVSFEPLAREFSNLEAAFKNDSNWIGYNVALGSLNETRSINIPKLTVMSSLLEPVVNKVKYETESVEIVRLDEIINKIGKINDGSRIFLKMDTQGFDVEVFKGAAGCMSRIFGLQSELSVFPLYKNMPDYRESLDVYESAGFALYNLSVVNRTDINSLLELNCFMHNRRHMNSSIDKLNLFNG